MLETMTDVRKRTTAMVANGTAKNEREAFETLCREDPHVYAMHRAEALGRPAPPRPEAPPPPELPLLKNESAAQALERLIAAEIQKSAQPLSYADAGVAVLRRYPALHRQYRQESYSA